MAVAASVDTIGAVPEGGEVAGGGVGPVLARVLKVTQLPSVAPLLLIAFMAYL